MTDKEKIIEIIEKKKEVLYNSPNFYPDEPEKGYAVLVELLKEIKEI